jgi:hypothetical protein
MARIGSAAQCDEVAEDALFALELAEAAAEEALAE